jgi:hypothetical protein
MDMVCGDIKSRNRWIYMYLTEITKVQWKLWR